MAWAPGALAAPGKQGSTATCPPVILHGDGKSLEIPLSVVLQGEVYSCGEHFSQYDLGSEALAASLIHTILDLQFTKQDGKVIRPRSQ